MSLHITTPSELSPSQAVEVARLVTGGTAGGASPALSEQALLSLQEGEPYQHAVATGADGALRGYAQSSVEGSEQTLELVTLDTGEAGIELASRLVEAVRLGHSTRELRLWAHGAASTAGMFARAQGWTAVRELLQMRRALAAGDFALEDSNLPSSDGITIRTFRPGLDDAAWLALNAAAFAHHREQGDWTQQDLQHRINTDWFDPAGFLLADRAGELIGFHWTKVHIETEPLTGEVYVLGVHPSAQGAHLGKRLLRAGLATLAARGAGEVLLYVEADNPSALRLYEGLGFAVFTADIQYAMPAVHAG